MSSRAIHAAASVLFFDCNVVFHSPVDEYLNQATLGSDFQSACDKHCNKLYVYFLNVYYNLSSSLKSP